MQPSVPPYSSLPPDVRAVVARVPLWAGARSVRVAPLRNVTSLNNANYHVAADGADYVLRVAADTVGLLGVRREEEREAALAAARVGVGPEVLFFDRNEGHMVTPLIAGRHWRPEDFGEEANIARFVGTLRRLHGVTTVRAQGSVFRRTERLLETAQARALEMPPDLAVFLDRMHDLEQMRRADTRYNPCLSHNDLWANNFLDDGERIWLLDWEFAGNADGLYDLATFALAGDYSEEQQRRLLHLYYGDASAPADFHSLQAMRYAVRFFEAAWALVQHGLRGSGGFDYSGYARRMFEALRGAG